MHTTENDMAVWTHRVLAAVARGSGDCRPQDRLDLARQIVQAPQWEGCPRAIDFLPEGTTGRYRRMSLRRSHAVADSSVLLIAWPPDHVTSIHDHDGLWGVELVLDGVLEVESFSTTTSPALQLASGGVTVLGVGDHSSFSEPNYAHRCRNLSTHRPALTLHIYGGVLERYSVFERGADGQWDSAQQRAELDLPAIEPT